MAPLAGHPGRRADPCRRPSSSSASPRPASRRSGRGRIANFETLGYADSPAGVLRRRHAHAPLAPLRGRRGLVPQLRPPRACRRDVPAGPRRPRETRTVAQPADDPDHRGELRRRLRSAIGASATAARSSRRRASPRDVVGRDGTRYPKGTAVPQRADFNTLDNPFFWSADPGRDGLATSPPRECTSSSSTRPADDFRRVRLAMDGMLPDGDALAFAPAHARPGVQLHASTRRTARTSSSRRAGTARSR